MSLIIIYEINTEVILADINEGFGKAILDHLFLRILSGKLIDEKYLMVMLDYFRNMPIQWDYIKADWVYNNLDFEINNHLHYVNIVEQDGVIIESIQKQLYNINYSISSDRLKQISKDKSYNGFDIISNDLLSIHLS